MQEIAWNITLILIIVIIGFFLFVILNSGKVADYAPVKSKFYAVRSKLFWILIVGFIIVTFSSYQDMPYAVQRKKTLAKDAQVINVEAFQWYWKLSSNTVKVNKPVIFNVTSKDVNHGMGIYDESLRLLAQTQAMPGYVNRLEHIFTQPGEYKILCMEYCGIVHHAMVSVIRVEAE